MTGEIERWRRPAQQVAPGDPREDAYKAGMDLVRQAHQDVVRPDAADPFSHPFFAGNFQQGRSTRETTHKRQVHYISETEYIMTEETTTKETLNFGNDIYYRPDSNRPDGKDK